MTGRREKRGRYDIHRRYLGLTVKSELEAKRRIKSLKLMAIGYGVYRQRDYCTEEKSTKIKALCPFFALKYWKIMKLPEHVPEPLFRRHNTVEDHFASDQNVAHDIRFYAREQVTQLCQGLKIPEIVRIPENKLKFSGEEVLLFSLRRLGSVGNLDHLARKEFGLDYSQWSRAFI
jgi:hypothetical protein